MTGHVRRNTQVVVGHSNTTSTFIVHAFRWTAASGMVDLGAPAGAKRAGGFPDRLAAAFRSLPVPVIGRIEDGQLRLDLRCLEDGDDERAFVAQLPLLKLPQRV